MLRDRGDGQLALQKFPFVRRKHVDRREYVAVRIDGDHLLEYTLSADVCGQPIVHQGNAFRLIGAIRKIGNARHHSLREIWSS